MNADSSNCHICGVELTPSNSFTCPNCGRSDVCIIHKGPESGMCSICLDNFRKRLTYPTFTIISLALLIFAPFILARIPLMMLVFAILILPLWLMIESARPVITTFKLKKLIQTVSVVAVFLLSILIVVLRIIEVRKYITLDGNFSANAFLGLGIVFLLLGFVYLLSTSLGRLGIILFNYDYPEEYSILLKKTGRDPELVGTLKWDLRWITWVHFVYGVLFIYLYIAPTG